MENECIFCSEKDKTIQDLSRQVASLKRGNTILLEALVLMVEQFFYENRDGTLSHSFISAEENAIAVLIDAGLAAEESRNEFLLFNEKLEERKALYGGRG